MVDVDAARSRSTHAALCVASELTGGGDGVPLDERASPHLTLVHFDAQPIKCAVRGLSTSSDSRRNILPRGHKTFSINIAFGDGELEGLPIPFALLPSDVRVCISGDPKATYECDQLCDGGVQVTYDVSWDVQHVNMTVDVFGKPLMAREFVRRPLVHAWAHLLLPYLCVHS